VTVAIVTGAARGMGRACVDRLKRVTEHLVAVDLVAPEIDGTIGLACDISDPAAISALAERVGALGPFRALAAFLFLAVSALAAAAILPLVGPAFFPNLDRSAFDNSRLCLGWACALFFAILRCLAAAHFAAQAA